MMIKYSEIFYEALDKRSMAGFQNMGDIDKACKYATKNGYDIEGSQELRSLILEKDNKIWLMFVLKLKSGKDIVVFNLGKTRENKYATNCFHPQLFLMTTPKKVMEI